MGTVVESDIRNDQENNYSKFNNVNINLRDDVAEGLQTDEELIKDYVNNNSFNLILKKYENIVFGLAYRILGNHSLSEEVMQEVFLILTKKLSTFREESKFSTWLYRVVVNVCYMYRKSEYKHNNNLRLDQDIKDDCNSQYIDYLEDSHNPSPYEDSKSSEIVEMVEKELINIPEKYRVVFILRDVEGLTNPEVAKILGITIAAVKSRILRARRFLKLRLQHKLQYES